MYSLGSTELCSWMEESHSTCTHLAVPPLVHGWRRVAVSVSYSLPSPARRDTLAPSTPAAPHAVANGHWVARKIIILKNGNMNFHSTL